MERIKQAVDKARGQRETPVMPGDAPGRIRPAAAGEDLTFLNYRHTRVTPLQAQHLERHRIVGHAKDHPATVAFDRLRTQVLQKMDDHGWRTLAITSPTPEAGKTMVGINLAMSIAHHTQRTAMLVDFDLRKPQVGNYLGLSQEASLNEVLDGTARLPDALVNPGIPRLVVLPTFRPVAHPAETLASTRVAALVNELRERYDERIVIFDLPPVLNTDDALAVLPQLDCVLLVVGEGMSSKVEIQESLRHLTTAKLLGVVLNKAQADAQPYKAYP